MNNIDKEVRYFLNQLLNEFPKYNLTEEDKKAAQRGVTEYILQKLLRKKFRKQKLHIDTLKEFNAKIMAKVKAEKPIHFTIPFGGYKHFWNPSHPEPDWAEIFALRFLTEWVSPILATYKPGIVIDFISEDLIIPRMNNYPDNVLEKYSQVFSKLVSVYQQSLPNNFQINFFRVGDRYKKEEIIKEVEKLLPARWKKWKTYTDDIRELELKRSRRSVMWKGKKDLTFLSEQEKENRMIESRLIELAYYDIEAKQEFLGDYYIEDNRIGICFSFGLSPDNVTHWITLGSTYASTVDYWIGRGILEKTSKGFIPRIVSKEQYQKISNNITKIQTEFTELSSKNYRSIELINSEDWYSIFKL